MILLTLPFLKRDSPVLTQDSAVCVLGSDGVEEEYTVKKRRAFWDRRWVLLGLKVLDLVRHGRGWWSARAAMAIDEREREKRSLLSIWERERERCIYEGSCEPLDQRLHLIVDGVWTVMINPRVHWARETFIYLFIYEGS